MSHSNFESLSLFDSCYIYIILIDNDRLLPSTKFILFQKIKRFFFNHCRHEYYSNFLDSQIHNLCSRQVVKNLLLFMYDNVMHEKSNSIFYKDFQSSLEIDSFLRLIARPSMDVDLSVEPNVMSSVFI